MTVFEFDVVYLARHGQTQWNLEGRRQGRLDSPLTTQGLLQVRRNAELIGGERVDAIFASPLGRARTSADVFAGALGLSVTVVDDLSEVDHGEWSGLTAAEIEAAWPGEAGVREHDKYFYRFPGGESYADADARARRALVSIARTGTRRPLLVAHEMVGRMLLRHLGGLGREDALSSSQPSEVVYRVAASRQIDRLGL